MENSGGVLSAGTVNVAVGASVNLVGQLTGNVENSGNVRIGDAAASAELTGSFTQTSTGALNIQVGGLTAGTEHDQLNVDGVATLSGTLNVALINGFSPADGDTFEVLTFGSRSGDFDTKNGLDLPGNSVFLTPLGANNMLLQAVGDDPPVIGSLSASPDPVLQSADLTLTATGVTDANSNIDSVRFYWDANNNGTLDLGTDQLLGTDNDGLDGWSLTEPAVLPVGTQTLLAQAEDTTNSVSNVVATTVQVDPSVYWDGEGGDDNWHTAANWSADTLPGPSDTVVINVAGEVTVSISSGVTVERILSGESITLNPTTLTVTGPSTINGLFTDIGGTITASGSNASIAFRWWGHH